MKLIKNGQIAGCVVTSVMMILLAGCMNCVYQLECDGDSPSSEDIMPYYEVSSLGGEDAILDINAMPIVVRDETDGRKTDESLIVLWGLTLGIIPALEEESEFHSVTVSTPLGTHMTTYSTIGKGWLGWIPCLIPYPAIGSFHYGACLGLSRTDNEFERLSIEGRRRSVDMIVSKFSQKEYSDFALKHNAAIQSRKDEEAKRKAEEKAKEDARMAAEKAQEEARIKRKKELLSKMLLEHKYDDVIAECANESSASEWQDFVTKAKAGAEEIRQEKEAKRVAALKKEIDELIQKGDYDNVIEKCEREIEYGDLGKNELWRSYLKSAKDKRAVNLKKIYDDLVLKANQGDANAQFELGKIYAIGNEVIDKDIKTAKQWLRKAYDNGNEAAWQELEKIMNQQ